MPKVKTYQNPRNSGTIICMGAYQIHQNPIYIYIYIYINYGSSVVMGSEVPRCGVSTAFPEGPSTQDLRFLVPKTML